MTRTFDGVDIRLPATLLGIGLGGFADGIVLHQILQWHHMLSSTDTDRAGVKTYAVNSVAGLEVNTLWDGFFHLATWVAVLAGLAILYSRVTRSRGRLWRSPALWGWALIGWGLFNLVEGIVDHHLLGIHHVRTGPYQTAWDLGFLALGAALVVVGWLVQRRATAVEPGETGRR